MSNAENSFFSRWSQRKVQARGADAAPAALAVEGRVEGRVEVKLEVKLEVKQPAAVKAEVIAVAPASAPASATSPPDALHATPKPKPPPTLADAALLTTASDFTPFIARNVAPEVKNAALKALFTDPHFNLMDGLDTYIDDYSLPDPLPAGMLRQMVQSKLLGIFDDEDAAALLEVEPEPEPGHPPLLTEVNTETDTDNDTARDENTALQLQPDDGAGRTSAAPGIDQDAGRQH